MTHRRASIAAVVAVATILAGCAGSGASATVAAPAATTTVDLPKSYRFTPESIVIEVGATVTWTNSDNFTHNVTLDGAEALTMSPGESATHTFAEAGTYPYVCSLHPRDMQGSVLVGGG
jgi:plastocyanin